MMNELSAAKVSADKGQDSTLTEPAGKLVGPLTLFKKSGKIYFSNFKTFALIGLLARIVATCLILLPFAIFMPDALGVAFGFLPSTTLVNMDLMRRFNGSNALTQVGFGPGMLLLFLVVVWIQFWGHVSLIEAAIAPAAGVRMAFKQGWKKVKAYYWVTFLACLIGMGGVFLLLIPAVVWVIAFSLSGYIVVAEGVKGMNALLKSREYIKGHWWAVAWRFLVLGLIIYLPAEILTSALKDQAPWLRMVQNFWVWLLEPLAVVYLYQLYVNLKALKGDFDFQPSRKIKVLFALAIITPFLVVLGIVVFWWVNWRKVAVRESWKFNPRAFPTPTASYRSPYPYLTD